MHRLGSGRDVLSTTMLVLGLDRRMLAGHKRYANIAAALLRRPVGAPRRGKADWTRRSTAAALSGDSPRIARANLPIAARGVFDPRKIEAL